jgi:hypothetical protein
MRKRQLKYTPEPERMPALIVLSFSVGNSIVANSYFPETRSLSVGPSSMQPICIARCHMRSGLVFTASIKVPNRFLLCRIVSASITQLHRPGASVPETINDSLSAVNDKSLAIAKRAN